MTTDVIVTKDGDYWFAHATTDKGLAVLVAAVSYTTDIAKAQQWVFECSKAGLTVESPALLLNYWQPTLRKISKTRRRRHNVSTEITTTI